MKVLFFATNSYPYGKGEPLVANQIESLAKEFDKIYIISSDEINEISYELPQNVGHFKLSFRLNYIQKITGLLNIFNKNVVEERKIISGIYHPKNSFSIFKVMLNSFTLAKRYERFFNKFIIKNKLDKDELYFHSYWCTEAVIGFALLKKKYPNSCMDSRIHAYDLYLERHNPEYLPFRKLIIDNINKLFFISEQGKKYFENKYQKFIKHDQLIINRLGVNHLVDLNIPKEKNVFNGIRIVSCSSIIELKRLNLIIETLSLIDNLCIEWIHFGDGYLQNEIEHYAEDKLLNKKNISYQFKGFIDNEKLHYYYQENQVDLFINTSLYEGIPISIMEAFAFRIPCIATNVGGVSEIVNEENGFLLNSDFELNELKEIIYSFNSFSRDIKLKFQKNAFDTWYKDYNGVTNYNNLIKNIVPAFKQCSRCLYDNKDYPEIKFDIEGVCDICHIYDDLQAKTVFKNDEGEKKLKSLLSKIKETGKNKQYDCILGVSGGVDSSYLASLAKEWGLKPLILHVDNGWNSELATKNIENILKVLNYDLYTHVINWEEMKDMQLSFLKASVVDIDLPFDNAFMAILYQIAKKYKIKYILSGHNTVTEGWMPPNFTHYKLDTINLKAIHNQFSDLKTKSFPLISPFKLWFYNKLYKVKFVSPLDFVEYNKAEVKKKLIEHLGWKDYGGKHYENLFTKFYQGYILPEKFKIDKRKAHLSTLICSKQISKKEALEEIQLPAYLESELEQDKEFFRKKMGLEAAEFEQIMREPIKRHTDYPSYINMINRLRKIKYLFIKHK